jgi:hypothetical protein
MIQNRLLGKPGARAAVAALAKRAAGVTCLRGLDAASFAESFTGR